VVAKVEFHLGELFPRAGFIAANLAALSRAVVRFYNQRGTAEQWIKGGKAGGEDDSAFLSPLSRQRGAGVAEPDRLQRGHLRALRATRCETVPSRRRWKHRGPKLAKTLAERGHLVYTAT